TSSAPPCAGGVERLPPASRACDPPAPPPRGRFLAPHGDGAGAAAGPTTPPAASIGTRRGARARLANLGQRPEAGAARNGAARLPAEDRARAHAQEVGELHARHPEPRPQRADRLRGHPGTARARGDATPTDADRRLQAEHPPLDLG